MMRLLGVFLISLLLFVCFAQAQKARTSKNQIEANVDPEKLWEEVIDAKGGRSRLLAVRNIVVSSRGRSRFKSQDYDIRNEDLYVFPNKWWSWHDARPTIFGLHISMRDWETGQQYTVSDNGEEFRGLKSIGDPNARNTDLAGITPDLLLETKWNRPLPKRVYSVDSNGKRRSAIETEFRGWRVDFVLDRISHLPVEIIAYSPEGRPAKTILARYIDVDGIKMPSEVTFEASDGDFTYTRSYKFNVEYNESIFRIPPPFESGPEAWRKR
jgi:hypothetical protein